MSEIEWHAPVEREFTEAGLRCFTVRTSMGHRCGYVILPVDHPLNGATLANSNGKLASIEVHGGITWHRPNDNDEWIIGFDCGHAGDYHPVLFPSGIRWSADDVEEETRFLAQQLQELAGVRFSPAEADQIRAELAKPCTTPAEG